MMANTREYLLVWDSTMANPNGDMLNDNKPRHDEITGQLEVSDVRIKRFIRDEWQSTGHNVLVRTKKDDKGKVMSCTNLIKEVMKNADLKENDLPEYILKQYIDVRLFGAVITKPKYDITGPLQVMWSKSVNPAEIKFMQGNSAYAGGEDKSQSTIWSKYVTPYALFKTYAVYNDNVAKKQGIEVSENDLSEFTTALINGLINYRSTSKNQMPRLLAEVVYKEHRIDGELNYVDVNFDTSEDEVRDISQTTLDLQKLNEYYESKKEFIDKIVIYKHNTAKIVNLPEEFEVINF
ncbi:type I-B CRISPR-associated protein Cas7/Csh2 [Methanohalophilus portucalensis]|uniref:CRISPR-associated protein, Csh2 family n=4 Tax=Methanohalophilus portucalensis TaxID=39664 RepID=A0A1X7N5R5_9EURY|nr:type I-B CRISPR-associated protein Cas7/Csh2 [Methanohalophilus portucalensis]SMH32739.1 CRISPR-associated protein, Csh2 family [Methanohalophilus portucalensis FDF-1]